MNRVIRTLAAVAVAAALLVAGIQSSNSSPEAERETVLVFGDSITQQYTNDPGDPMQGWWSLLANARGMNPVISAQGGGGIIKKGYTCAGTSIRERFREVVQRVRPDEIWIAAGKNDAYLCVNGKQVNVATKNRRRAFTSFFTSLGALADEMGIPRTRIYVTTPWGTNQANLRRGVVVDMATAARAAGMVFINTPRMGKSLTRDGTHPNTAGSRYIAQWLAPRMGVQ